VLSVAAPAIGAEGAVADERAVQATFLFHFTRFVQWPPSAFESNDEPFRICVIGDDPFGEVLDRAVRDETTAGRPIRIERYRRPSAAARCQIAYLAEDVEPDRLADLPGFEDGLVFTVGETKEFLERGGTIRFLMRRGRVALAVNEQARQRLRLHVSSKLLQLSELEYPEPRAETEPEQG
jgi:hypothetical protein